MRFTQNLIQTVLPGVRSTRSDRFKAKVVTFGVMGRGSVYDQRRPWVPDTFAPSGPLLPPEEHRHIHTAFT